MRQLILWVASFEWPFAKSRRLEHELQLAQLNGARALERLFSATYDIANGLRVCRTCRAAQFEFPSGHAPGCVVQLALNEALEILS